MAYRARDEVAGWCILRTNSRSTLRLAQSLGDAGIEAWTPRMVQKRRLSRVHMGFREVEQAMVPSFVFARSCHLPDLMTIVASFDSPHPSFSIFQHAGRAPVIADREIAQLQSAEERSKRDRRKAQRHTIASGTKVKPGEGAFAGLEGVVVGMNGKDAVVSFGGHLLFNVATWLLVGEEVQAA